MSSNPSPGRRGWRPEETSARKRPIGPRWRTDDRSAVAPPRRRYRWGRVFLAAALFLLFACGFVWVSFWLRPTPNTTIILAGASYQDNLAVPANLYGWNGLKDLAELGPWAARSGGSLRVVKEPREFRLDEDWKKTLRTAPGKTLLICLSLHGGADGKGGYLLSPGAYLSRDPLSPEKDRIRLEELFDSLRLVPKEKNIVLVLDATQVLSDWSLGMLHNDFARALEKLNQRILDTPNLVVLSASSADEKSWPSESWQRTIFQHYLIEGLRGGADASDGTLADNRVNAAELYHFVHRQVKGWAAANRDASQSPVLLPLGTAGLERAKQMHLTLARNYEPSDPATLKPFTPPGELEGAWKRYQQLREQSPAPAVYAPQQWRLYQERLLRYEQLLQAGYQAAASTQLVHLRDLEQDIDRARNLDRLGSIGNSLGMYSLAGYSLPGRESLAPVLNRLWEAPAADWPRLWAESQKTIASEKGSPPVLGLTRLRELTLERTLEAPLVHLAKGRDLLALLRLTEDRSPPLPIEGHFLVMLQRYLPGWNGDVAPIRQTPNVLQKAMRVKLLAEKAALGGQPTVTSLFERSAPPAAYSEQLLPWFRTLLEEADTLRRKGEDLLFATEPTSIDKAGDFLDEAERRYRKVEEVAQKVRRALAVRDQVVPQLPFQARWLGERRPREDAGGPTREAQQTFLTLCEETHSLEGMLGLPITGAPKEEDLARLEQLAERVQGLHQKLESAARAFRMNLEEIELPSVWRDIDAALAMPFPDVERRLQLLAARSRIGLRFAVNYGSRAPVSVERSHTRESPKEQARVRGMLALHLFGKPAFDLLGHEGESFDEVHERLRSFGGHERWWEALQVTAEQIAERWDRIPAAIERALETSRKAGPELARAELFQADHLSRYVGPRGIPGLTANGPRAYRLALAEELLLNQARRTWLDHWADEDPTRESYYLRAGMLYLNDAQALLEPSLLGPDPRIAKARAELQKADVLRMGLVAAPGMPATGMKGALATKGPVSLQMTSELEFPLRYRLEAAGPTQGYAVLWAEAGPGLMVKAGPVAAKRAVQPIDAEADVLLDVLLAPDLPRERMRDVLGAQESALTVRGFWRGHAFGGVSPVNLYAQAHTVVTEHPLPLRASVAVRAPKELHQLFGAASGAVTIVLDCSGSMGPVPGRPPTEKTKYQEAVEALRKVLAQLPRGATVSIWTFGQNVGLDAAPEKTISRILPPTAWDPDNADQLNALIVSLEQLRPWNESPVVRAMIQASQDLKDTSGFKTLLVLTDGLDNRFVNDKEFNPDKADIAAALRHYFTDIEVNLVGFRLREGEEDKARAQFAEVEKLPIPGNIYMVQEAEKLAAVLDRALKQQLRYWVEQEDGRLLSSLPPLGLGVSYDRGSDQWVPGGLTPGGYKVRVQTNKRLSRPIALNRGDLLLLELDRLRIPGVAGEPLGITRPYYALADFPWRPMREKGSWLLASLQNQRKEKSVEMLLSLERKDDPLNPTLQQTIPYKAWFEVIPSSDVVNVLPPSRWHYQPGYPAPAYSYLLPDWPVRPGTGAALRPFVRAWWSPEQDPPAAAAIDKGHDFTDPRAIRNLSLTVNDQEIVVESVQVENHLVEIRPADGKTEDHRQMRPCLVVRLKSAPTNPVYVRVQGVSPVGAEHRFYREAGKYTAIFWPVTRDEMVLSLRRIEIVSLNAFKRDAEDRKCMIELDLAEPQATDERPIPPVGLIPLGPESTAGPGPELPALPVSRSK